MIKTFIFGLIVGIAGFIAALHAVPVVDQHREASIVSVTPNGGNAEQFHINVPEDRILIGAQDAGEPLPPGLEWPLDPIYDGVRAELFKLRNSRDVVVGVASRLDVNESSTGDVVEWLLHLPARGSMYLVFDAAAASRGRIGNIRGGTRDFEQLIGSVAERWVPDRDAAGAAAGRIELLASFVSTELPPLPEEGAEEVGE